MKRRNFIVPWGTYPFDVMVSVNEPTENVVAAIKRSGYVPDREEVERLDLVGVGKTTILRGGQIVVRLKNFDGRASAYACLSHEVFHAVSFLFDRIGIKYGDGSDEAWAYAIQHMTQGILARLNR